MRVLVDTNILLRSAQPSHPLDARLVALMNLYSIDSILTFNVADFKRYSNITALHPTLLP